MPQSHGHARARLQRARDSATQVLSRMGLRETGAGDGDRRRADRAGAFPAAGADLQAGVRRRVRRGLWRGVPARARLCDGGFAGTARGPPLLRRSRPRESRGLHRAHDPRRQAERRLRRSLPPSRLVDPDPAHQDRPPALPQPRGLRGLDRGGRAYHRVAASREHPCEARSPTRSRSRARTR